MVFIIEVLWKKQAGAGTLRQGDVTAVQPPA